MLIHVCWKVSLSHKYSKRYHMPWCCPWPSQGWLRANLSDAQEKKYVYIYIYTPWIREIIFTCKQCAKLFQTHRCLETKCPSQTGVTWASQLPPFSKLAVPWACKNSLKPLIIDLYGEYEGFHRWFSIFCMLSFQESAQRVPSGSLY